MNYYSEASYLDSPDQYEAEAWPVDFDAEAKPKSPPPVRPSPGGSTFRPRPAPGGGGSVTQAQLEAALARVREQITANSNAIRTVDGRVRTVISDTQKLQAMTRKDVEKLRGDLRNTQTLSAILPLFGTTTPLGRALPLLHLVGSDFLQGSQGSSSNGGSILGSNSNLIAIAALAFASGVFG
jgi:hypothetical protein